MRASPSPLFFGRQDESADLDALLADLKDGRSAVKVLRGPAGVGKTALLEYATSVAAGMTLVRASGVQADMELAYAGVHQLCASFLSDVDEIPAPQRDALRVAFGIAAGEPPDRFLVGLAVLSLLTRASESGPVLAIIDDAQWLDQVSKQTLEFVARRLLAESVGMVFAVRDPDGGAAFSALPALRIDGLDPGAAGALVEASVGGRLDPQVRDRLVAEASGNPLALLEFTRGRNAAELAYGLDPSSRGQAQGSVSARVERDFVRRMEALPSETRTLLLIAAAEPVGDPRLLVRAAEAMKVPLDAAPARAAGLIELGDFVRFRHPLARSAVYHQASPAERRAAHRALAQATDPVLDPDRRAWHAAQAADGWDEEAAAGLEHAAERARQRGGMAAEAALLERAAELTPEPWARGRRALAAAEAHFSAAAPQSATDLAALADMCPLSPLDSARLARLRARVLFTRSRSDEAAPLLLEAASQFAAVSSHSARETYLEAISATVFAGRVHGPSGARAAAVAARDSGAPSSGSKPADLLLDGISSLLSDGPRVGVPVLQRSREPFLSESLTTREETLRWLLLVPVALESFIHYGWDLPTWDALASRAVRLARDAGALGVLPPALIYAGGVQIHRGDFAAAARMIDEADTLALATGNAPHIYAALVLTAWKGDEDAAARIVREAQTNAAQRGEVSLLGVTGYVQGVLYNGLAQYKLALQSARIGIEHDGFNFTGLSLVEHVEAAVRCGEMEQARASLARLAELTDAANSGWARGIGARSRALVEELRADELYEIAIDELTRDQVMVEVARTHLLFGEHLRRSRRRARAREQLRIAYEMFDRMGARAFAERAKRELEATGEHVQVRDMSPISFLTPQELRIASLAGSGMTNPQIGAELFISTHTVEWHLRKVYTKLGIGSRRELPSMLGAGLSSLSAGGVTGQAPQSPDDGSGTRRASSRRGRLDPGPADVAAAVGSHG
ncbi:helix-turn-helix transcriptional regulator [Nocardioides nitrophenolicus]|uniref:helix-turn-helix transcriptional regulator n=1 Tax=Nocardioides nitrophenolicus TaxID=60489 RepID=UPI00195AA62E|nr:helix-turn-helix transcriptional regulator [Nocardioides nitrophenolicus]MBM7518634.1 DNA-binding CsgD family transcriptional regulator [Nocardioides nitrophenolicus]